MRLGCDAGDDEAHHGGISNGLEGTEGNNFHKAVPQHHGGEAHLRQFQVQARVIEHQVRNLMLDPGRAIVQDKANNRRKTNRQYP